MSQLDLNKEDSYDLELLRQTIRASQGLSLTEQDILTFLIDAKNYRERTRIPENGCYDYSGWEMLAEMYPLTFGWLKDQAKTECIYFISLDGLQRQEAIMMTKAKNVSAGTPLTIENVQNPMPIEQQQVAPAKPEKKGWLHR